jgi:hypothetical protein
MSILTITIPENPPFFSLYADGPVSGKTFNRGSRETLLFFPGNAVIVLYYTYPTRREACVVRNTVSGKTPFPGLSKPVSPLFSVQASGVDKLRRAFGFLRQNSSGPFSHDDGFYLRLFFLLRQRGKISPLALTNLAARAATTLQEDLS